MKKKKILIDLSILKHINCGSGQVALNYGKYFRDNYFGGEYDIFLLVPRSFVGSFGVHVKYISANIWNKHFPCLIPRFDAWHAIHQLSPFNPFYKNTKYLLTIHDFNFMYEKTSRKIDKYLNKIQRKINRANKICCISTFSKNETEKYAKLNGKKIEVIFNGVEQLKTSEESMPAFIGNNSYPFFFTIGQIKEKKNFHSLLDLMKLFPQKKLYIAGPNNTAYAEMIRTRIKTENITNVFLVGAISHEEKIWLYNHCEAFLFPSLFEGFGLPIIEAMSFGKPVFSSQETSLKEIGGAYAYFWNNFEANAMKSVIDENLWAFYSNPSTIEKSVHYAQSFTYERHMKSYMKIYDDLINNSSPV